nr:M23 family metallopeptidase [Mobiluncus sp. Marseille-Q7826]
MRSKLTALVGALAALGIASMSTVSLSYANAALTPANATTASATGLVRADKNSDERKKLEAQQAASKKKQAELAAQLEGVNANLVQLAVALEQTKAAIPVAQTEVANAQAKLADAQAKHQQIQSRLAIANRQKEELREQIAQGEQTIEKTQVAIGQMARMAYRGAMLETSPLSLLLDSQSLDELTLRAQVAATATKSQNRAIVEAQEANAANNNARARQEAVTVRIGELETQAQQAVQAADEARVEQQRKLGEFQELQQKQVAQQGQLNNQRAAFEKQIADEKATQAAAAARIAALNQQPDAMPARSISGGIFGAPLSSLSVTSPYGYRVHPITKTRRLHAGTDFGIGCGTPIYASQSGTVTFAGWEGTGGKSTYINHGTINGSKWQTTYRHQSQFKVSVGASVQKGQVIGLVGSTGGSTGCHLHFEVWQNGKTINPLGVL